MLFDSFRLFTEKNAIIIMNFVVGLVKTPYCSCTNMFINKIRKKNCFFLTCAIKCFCVILGHLYWPLSTKPNEFLTTLKSQVGLSSVCLSCKRELENNTNDRGGGGGGGGIQISLLYLLILITLARKNFKRAIFPFWNLIPGYKVYLLSLPAF